MNTYLLPAHIDSPEEYMVDNLFSLLITQKQTSAKITMQLFYNQVNTCDIPVIVDLLQEHLPNVLFTQCFNDEGFPFNVEVKNTEIGHLFEHILLNRNPILIKYQVLNSSAFVYQLF